KIHWLSSVKASDAAKFPASKATPQESTGGVVQERQVIHVFQDQHVGTVGVRRGTPAAQIGIVYPMIPHVTGRGVDAVRIRVCRLEDETVADSVAEINLQGVVAGNC